MACSVSMSPLSEAPQCCSSRARVLASRSVALCTYVTLAAGNSLPPDQMFLCAFDPPRAARLYVRLSRKVAMESSSSCHHGVWWTGAMVPVQGEEKDRSRYPVMLVILSCSHSLKCARV